MKDGTDYAYRAGLFEGAIKQAILHLDSLNRADCKIVADGLRQALSLSDSHIPTQKVIG